MMYWICPFVLLNSAAAHASTASIISASIRRMKLFVFCPLPAVLSSMMFYFCTPKRGNRISHTMKHNAIIFKDNDNTSMVIKYRLTNWLNVSLISFMMHPFFTVQTVETAVARTQTTALPCTSERTNRISCSS